MAKIIHQYLFSWEEVERSSELQRLQLVLSYLDDEEVVQALEGRRGRGRDTYPVRPTWNALLAGIVFQHATVESLLRELRRNGELRAVCGFNPLRGADAVPSSFAMSRFLSNVMRQSELITAIFDSLVERLSQLLPDLGAHLAFDGKAVPSHSTGRVHKDSGTTSDPDADWGRKTYRGVNAQGKGWEKVKRWFGYQLHLIVDADYELPVAFEMLPASTNETTRLLPMVKDLASSHPEVVERCRDLSADRGLDSAANNQDLWEEHRIKPVIDTRALWRNEKTEVGYEAGQEIARSLDPCQVDAIVYTERGEVRCICPVSGKQRKMAFRGFEAERGVLGYRCPAAAYGFACEGRAVCEKEALGRASAYGRVVRVPLDLDRRVFTPIPRNTPRWRRLYAKRTSVERVNGRLDCSFGFEHHTIRGLKKMKTRMGLALVVMLAMAVAHICQGQPELMRSLVGSSTKRRLAA